VLSFESRIEWRLFFAMQSSQGSVPTNFLDASGKLIVREKHSRKASSNAATRVAESPLSSELPERKKGRRTAQRGLSFADSTIGTDANTVDKGASEGVPADESVLSSLALQADVVLPVSVVAVAADMGGPSVEGTVAESARGVGQAVIIVDDWQAQAMVLFNAKQCSCSVLAKRTVKDLQNFAKTRSPPIRHRRDGAELRKKDQLLEICRVCKSIDEVIAAMGGAGYRHGVAPEYWYPVVDQQRLTIFSAVHLAFVAEGIGKEFSMVLNDFRAHFLKVIKVNWRFYVVRGKINKVGEVGQRAVFTFSEKLSNFLMSLESAIEHYRDNHSDMTCGRLRKHQTCVPFQIFQRCDVMVERIVTEIVNTLVTFALEKKVTSIDSVYENQFELKQAFNLL
jgi:hypothetical protein